MTDAAQALVITLSNVMAQHHMVSLLSASGLLLSGDVFLLSPIIHLLYKNYPRVQ